MRVKTPHSLQSKMLLPGLRENTSELSLSAIFLSELIFLQKALTADFLRGVSMRFICSWEIMTLYLEILHKINFFSLEVGVSLFWKIVAVPRRGIAQLASVASPCGPRTPQPSLGFLGTPWVCSHPCHNPERPCRTGCPFRKFFC